MNDDDQTQLATRLADVLATRIETGMATADIANVRSNLKHLLRLDSRAEQSRMAAILQRLQDVLPATEADAAGLSTQLAHAKQRLEEQARRQAIVNALNDPNVRPFGEPRALPEATIATVASAARHHPTWPHPPVFDDAWQDLDGKEIVGDLALLNRALHSDPFFRSVLRAGVVAGRRCGLSCYDGVILELLLEAELGKPQSSVVFLLGSFGALPFDGTSRAFHVLNQLGRLDISTEDKATQYIRLFCGLVHGDDGPFTIVADGPAVLQLLQNSVDLPPAVMAAPRFALTPPSESEDAWQGDATIVYGSSVFSSRMAIEPSGNIKMLGDEKLAADLPVRQARFREGRRAIYTD